MEHLENSNKEQEDSINLVAWLNRILAHWYWFVIGLVIMIFIGWTFLRYTTPVYRTSAKLLVVDQNKGVGMLAGGLMGDFGGMMGVKSNVDNEVEVLKTYDLMREVVQELDAYIQYRFKGRVIETETLNPKYFLEIITPLDSIHSGVEMSLSTMEDGRVEIQIKEDAFKHITAVGEMVVIPHVGHVRLKSNLNYAEQDVNPLTDEQQLIIAVNPVDLVTEAYRKSLAIGVTNKQTSTIDLSFDHALPVKGRMIMQTLLDKYVQRSVQDRNTIADSTMAFIDDRLLFVGEELGIAEERIQVFKQESQLADMGTQSQLLLESANSYAKDLASVESRLLLIDEAEKYLADPKHLRVMPTTISNSDPIFGALVQNYNQLLLERERLLLGQTENNPYVVNLDQQIQVLREDMRSNLQSSRRQLQVTRDGLARQTKSLEAEIRKVPATERSFIDLARQQRIKQELYLFLQQKWEETAISKQANISNSKVIDTPRTDSTPISPKKIIIYLACLVLGILFPFGILYLRELLNVRVSSKEDITSRLPMPIVGEIVSNDEGDEQIVVSKESRSPISEQFRALRTNLDFFNNKLGSRTLLFTSSMSGEGKSFVAVNLAITIALSGKKVVLVEFDLRKPTASAKLNRSSKFGFTNYVLQPELEVQDIVQPSGVMDNMCLVSSGPIPPNPAEIILNSRTDDFFDYLKQHFDYIILDAPPVGVVTDAQLLSKYADNTLYVVRHGITFKKQLEIPLDLVKHHKLPQVSLIINGIEIKRYGGYGGYGGYGYGYGYYMQESKRKWWWPFRN